MATDKFDSRFTEFCENYKVSGGTFSTVLPRTMEFQKTDYISFSSFYGFKPHTITFAAVCSNFVQSMKLTIDIVKRKRKVEQRWWKMKLGRKRDGEKEREE